MFDALARGDTAAMRATFVPEGRVVQTGTREGKPFYRVNSSARAPRPEATR